MLVALVLLQTALTVALPGPTASSEYLPVRLAEADGYFAAEGLKVTLRSLPSEAGPADALAKGRADLAATSLDAALRLGHTKGAPPRLVFGLSRTPPVALLVSRAISGAIGSPGELAGKTVGIPGPGTPEHTQLVSLLNQARLPLHRVSIQSLGERGLAQAIESGAVAAGMIGEPWATRLVQDGKAVALVDLRQPGGAATALGTETVHAAVFAPAKSELGARDLVSFDRALLRAVERLRTAPAEELAARLGAAATGGPDGWPAQLAGARGVLLPDGRVSAETLEASIRLARERSLIPASVIFPRRMDDLILSEPLREALGRRP